MTEATQADPLDALTDVQLAERRNALRALAFERQGKPAPSDPSIPFISNLTDEECAELVNIFNALRRRAGKGPKSGPKQPVLSETQLMDL